MANHDATSSDFIYDIFLSFRGGSCNAFIDRLHQALFDKGIKTFRVDEEQRIGDEINPAILEAIEKSRTSMVVLCENYASSTWCLDELAKIMEYYDKKGKRVSAIFYKVEPSDVRYQKNSYKEPMIEHEKRFGQASEKLKAWRSALSRVCDLSGGHCRDNESESELIKKIVRDTTILAPAPLQIDRVVGFDSRFEDVKSLIDVASNDTICMLGIYGTGGIGKTTFAAVLYNKIRHQFEAACFLVNVRERSNKSSIKGLEDLQKTLLSKMGEENETIMGSTFKGGIEIKNKLGRRRVLLVLDDVDTVKQLESLVGGPDWFGLGSRIIITTRDAAVLDKYDVEIKKYKYKMEELNDPDSLELFCWNTFNMSKPVENFANISSCAVSYAKGIPLALRVIGSNLKGQNVEEWEIELDKYRKVPHAEIQGVLEISYHSLSDLDQKIFLDIACFFKGEKWVYVQRILEACDFYPTIGVFVSKCLMIVDENGCLDMHDLIQEMGREIVRKESPSNPGNRSRLWSHKDILQVLKENSGSSQIEGIMLHPHRLEEVDHSTNTAFKKMENLRILVVRNTIFSTGPSYLPNSLRLLDWMGYPSESFPLDFCPQKIVDFKLSHCPLTLKQPLQKFEELTFINLSQCQSIIQIPNVSGAKNLRVLTLDRCHKLVGFDKSIGFMPKLAYLSALECSMLKSFVPRMHLPSLEVLSFNFCIRLEQFPDVKQKMDKPLKIWLTNTAIKEFPKSIDRLIGLEYIDMSNCRGLKGLSSSFLLLPKLVTLKIDGCSQLGESFKRFRKNHSVANDSPNIKILSLSEANLSDEDLYVIENFPKLEDLNISHNDFVSLPKCIKGSKHLKSLNVSYCRHLKEIPELPLSIQKVDARYCRSLISEASSGLWSKVSKENKRIQVVMPKTAIPNWFNCVHTEDIPLFWARRKFPVVAFAFVFGIASEILPGIESVESQIVGLHLFIDGQEICRKDCHDIIVGEDHVLFCDLRVLFTDEEWLGLDASLGDDWKAVQVQCESKLILSYGGVYVYKQETSMDDILFTPPNPNSSSSRLVLKITPEKKMGHTESFNPKEVFGKYLDFFELEQIAFVTDVLLRWNAEADIRGEASASAYGASLKQEHQEFVWDVVQILEMFMTNVPKHIANAYPEEIQSAGQLEEELLMARAEFLKEKGHETLQINMPIVLKECHPTPSCHYWGSLELKLGDPNFKAVWRTMRWTNQLVWRSWKSKEAIREKVNIVLLKCQHPSTEEASGSSNGESVEEEYNDPEMEALMRRIEEDAMSLNKDSGTLKASIVLKDKYLIKTMIMRGQERLGMLGSNFKKTSYGKLRVEHDAWRTTQNQKHHEMRVEPDAQYTTQNQKQPKLGWTKTLIRWILRCE